MRRIVSNFFITLDGVVEAPNEWNMPYFDQQMGAVVQQGMSTSTALRIGRRNYDEWAAYWPEQDSADPIAATMNGIEKVLITSHPDDVPEWQNTTVLSGDVAARVRELKASGEGDIGMSGSATTTRWLLSEGLLDELVLLVHPLAVGRGARLFEDGDAATLSLVSSEALPSGVLHLRYAPAS